MEQGEKIYIYICFEKLRRNFHEIRNYCRRFTTWNIINHIYLECEVTDNGPVPRGI